MLSWGAIYLRRVFEMSPGEVGLAFGGIAAVAGGIGSLGGGVLADRLARRDPAGTRGSRPRSRSPRSRSRWPSCSRAAAASRSLAFAPFYLLNNLYVASLWTLVQGLVAPGLRATASATQLAVTNVVGYGVGPLLVGFANDALAPTLGNDAIRWSLLGAAVIGAASALFFWHAADAARGPERGGA